MWTLILALEVLAAIVWPVAFIGLAEARGPLRRPWRAVLTKQRWLTLVLGGISAILVGCDILMDAPALVLAVDTVGVLAALWLRYRAATGWPALRRRRLS